ncbi:amidase signature domain-containing protein [Cubamyces lactineus]|nr:amidase signature domain-containing protein [Cubamyces lactineus]
MWPFSSHSYLDVTCRKQTQRDDAIRVARADIPQECFGAHAEPYLRATAQDIVERISKGEWTASEVLDAYISRAIHAQDVTNCLTEVLFAEARAQAKALDAEFAQTGKVRGPLHGVPVTFKDTFDIKGHDTTLGFSSHAVDPRPEDALVVLLVRDAGGIPICKTNLSQLIFFFECSNPIWGRTLNPYSKSYSSGGTSGGEAALLAMDGAVSAGGPTSAARSVQSSGCITPQIPASFCGIYSLKPGWSRISMTGMQGTWPGFEGIRTVAGPMGRSVDDIELAARLVFGKQGTEYDPAPLPYRAPEMPKKLRFGFYLSDNFVKPSPACQCAVLETVEALRKAGHECLEFELPEGSDPLLARLLAPVRRADVLRWATPTSAKRAMEIFIGITAADKYKTLSADLGNDPLEPGVTPLVVGPRLPGWFRNSVAWLLGKLYKDEVFPGTMCAACEKPVVEYHRWVRQSWSPLIVNNSPPR